MLCRGLNGFPVRRLGACRARDFYNERGVTGKLQTVKRQVGVTFLGVVFNRESSLPAAAGAGWGAAKLLANVHRCESAPRAESEPAAVAHLLCVPSSRSTVLLIPALRRRM